MTHYIVRIESEALVGGTINDPITETHILHLDFNNKDDAMSQIKLIEKMYEYEPENMPDIRLYEEVRY